MMKNINLSLRTVFLLIILLLFVSNVAPVSAACGSLGAATGNVSGTTTTAANTWQDTGAQATIDLGSNTGDIFVISSIQSSSTANAMTASWQLTDGTTTSTQIERYIASANDFGVGTVSHIFQNLSGSNTFGLQHQTDTNNRNTITTATIVAIPLITDAGNALNHGSVMTTGTYSTSSMAYSVVPDTNTSVLIPTTGDIYVAASLNSSGGSGQSSVGEWKLQYRRSPSGVWNDLGWPTQRTLSGNNDTAAVSLTALGKNLGGGSYEFRLAVSSLDARNVNTFNVTLSAIAFVYEYDGSMYGFFPAQQSHSDMVAITQVDTREIVLEVNQDISTESGAQLFMTSQYQMGGNNGGTTMTFDVAVDDGTAYQSVDQRRKLSNTGDIGNGGSVGLSGFLTAGSNHDFQFRFESDATPAVLTDPVFVSIGMTCRDNFSPTAVTLLEFSVEDDLSVGWVLPALAFALLLSIFWALKID